MESSCKLTSEEQICMLYFYTQRMTMQPLFVSLPIYIVRGHWTRQILSTCILCSNALSASHYQFAPVFLCLQF